MITSLFKDEKELDRLSKSLQKAVKNPATLELLKNISADMSLSQEQENNFTDIVFSIIKGEVELYDCVSLISGVLKIDFEVALEINDRLYENLFFSIESDINDQFILYQKTKAPIKEPVVAEKDIEKSQKEKSEFIPLIEKAIKKFKLFGSVPPSLDKEGQGAVEKVKPGQTSPNLSLTKEREEKLKKFSEMAETFLSGVRTKSQFKNTLTKDTVSGGLGMEKQMADDVAEFLASYMRIGEIEKKKISTSPNLSLSKERKEEKSPPAPLLQRGEEKEIPPLTPPLITRGEKEPRPVLPNVKIEVSFEKSSFAQATEDREVKRMEKKVEKIKTQAPKLLSVTEGVAKALAELNYNFPSSELQERLKSVIDARVRNVRTSLQTFDKLTQDIPSGGLGFSKLEADKVSLVLNKYLEDKNKDIYGSKLAEIKKAEDEEKNKNMERARAAEDAERKNLDDRFTKMTGKSVPSVVPDVPSGIEGQYSGTQKKSLDSRLRGNDTRGEEKKQIPLPPEEAPEKIPNPKSQIPNKSQISNLKSSIINQKSEVPQPRPVLEDIKFTPKLAGPTEEIARLSIDDFRKLSGDPKEAVLKIKDKLALLRGESYKKYQGGIDAWRNSPLYGEYLNIINKSLSDGVPLDGAISAAKTLTKDEFDAIINSKVGD